MNKRLSVVAALWTVVLAVVGSASASDGKELKVSTAFSATTYLEHVKFLSSDELGGRGTGSPGIDRAADYIAAQLEKAGCQPAGDDGTFFQAFEVAAVRRIDPDQAHLELKGAEQRWQLGKDWTPMPFSGNDPAEGPLAFAGYGIEAPEHEYNDYADFDAGGKVLIILRYEPRSADKDAEFGGEQRSRYALFATKANKAAENGAVALLVVDPRGEAEELYDFSSGFGGQTYKLPMASITRAAADKLLAAAGLPDVRTLESRIEQERRPASADLKGLSVRLTPGLAPVKTRNVVGLLPGDGSCDDVIVVGAHYDHLGTTGEGDKKRIHNGADDNASGTTGVIELARVFGAGPKLRRSILFMTFSGEELGLHGSRWFVDHPTIDLSRVKAMFNMDMIGRYGQHKFEVWGVDTAEEFADLVQRCAEAAGVEYSAPNRSGNIFGRSDHASFYRKKIPVLFPFTGLHPQYHQPEDDWEQIDSEGAVKVLQFAHLVLGELASMEKAPTYVERRRPDADRPADTQESPADADRAQRDADDDAPPMPRVRLGIMPSYAGDGKPGMLIDGVIEGGAAAKAGLLAGDRIVRIAGQEVADITGYMTALRDVKPGQPIDVVVLRDGVEKTFQVTPGEPGRRRGGD